jgi:hypothetical protein
LGIMLSFSLRLCGKDIGKASYRYFVGNGFYPILNPSNGDQ